MSAGRWPATNQKPRTPTKYPATPGTEAAHPAPRRGHCNDECDHRDRPRRGLDKSLEGRGHSDSCDEWHPRYLELTLSNEAREQDESERIEFGSEDLKRSCHHENGCRDKADPASETPRAGRDRGEGEGEAAERCVTDSANKARRADGQRRDEEAQRAVCVCDLPSKPEPFDVRQHQAGVPAGIESDGNAKAPYRPARDHQNDCEPKHRPSGGTLASRGGDRLSGHGECVFAA